MVFIYICIFILSTKVASALEGLRIYDHMFDSFGTLKAWKSYTSNFKEKLEVKYMMPECRFPNQSIFIHFLLNCIYIFHTCTENIPLMPDHCFARDSERLK